MRIPFNQLTLISIFSDSSVRTLAEGIRRLMINGSASENSEFSFVVSILNCSIFESETKFRSKCRHFCSGSLIAPDVVLTAAHCLISDSSANGASMNLLGLRVLVGSSTISIPSQGSKLVKVRDFFNAGYMRNASFPLNDDVGLLLLDSCLKTNPQNNGSDVHPTTLPR